ncbi:ABC transporter ATP-binding protein [Amycolatopsis jejuensis]|uniref:ABC transporter ATP-binding protein n=1 Tax=Amycolatopsis jejuensis TaxID=330084 RepID=UPI000691E100|nr:ABC transporter ATP-binding protein [Amycolatopsis jejuensis]
MSSPQPPQPVPIEATGPELISCRDVSVVFPSRDKSTADSVPAATQALDNINLDIRRGEFVTLVGATGCGKTTLLNMVAGLVQPTTGRCTVDGAPVKPQNLDIGYMFARDALLPWRTVLRNVELGMEARGWARDRRRTRAREMLELVGLADRERAFRSHLSQGMRQRVALARTWAIDPSILLMDEPFAALDARTRLGMQAEFLRIWEGQPDGERKTVLFVTHDLQEATLLSDRVVIMLPSPGRIAADVQIDLPRPRADRLGEVVFDPKFREIEHYLFERLEGAAYGARPAAGTPERKDTLA